MNLKSIVKKVIDLPLWPLGLEIRAKHKIHPVDESPIVISNEIELAPEHSPNQWLIDKKIKTVLDIGANTGQFAATIHEIIPKARIVSFEPLKDCYKELLRNGENLGSFKAYNCALGTEEGKVTIYRSEFSPSSSLLPMGDLHKEAYPFTKNGTEEKVKVRKLDKIKRLGITYPLLVKIDVQGFEDKVIDGGYKTIREASVLIVEASFQTLYEGQPMFDDIYARLKKLGFSYHGNWYQDNDSRNGSALQADAIFIKTESPRNLVQKTINSLNK